MNFLVNNENEYKYNPISFLKVMACVCIFLLHTSIFNARASEFYNLYSFTFLFKTPAWAGVWIFLTISGYLSGKGFFFGRYDCLSTKGILEYYWQRITKIYIPMFCFIFLCVILVYPNLLFENVEGIWTQIITFTYRGFPSIDGISATWYLFMLAWFYLAAPFISRLVMRINNHKIINALFCLVFILGGAYRIAAFLKNIDWTSRVYTPVYANVDLFVCGLLFSYLQKEKTFSKIVKILYPLLLLLFVFANCYVYYLGDCGNSYCSALYRYIFPSVYLLLVIIYLDIFVTNKKYVIVKSRLLLFIEKFSSITFEFYLFHSLVLHVVSPYIYLESVFWHQIALIGISAFLTLFLSIGYHRIFETHLGKKEALQ